MGKEVVTYFSRGRDKVDFQLVIKVTIKTEL